MSGPPLPPGGRLHLRSRTWTVERILRRHPDKSASYLIQGDAGVHVARIFPTAKSTRVEELSAVNVGRSRGLAEYEAIDLVELKTDTGFEVKRWVTVRNYSSDTLEDFLDGKVEEIKVSARSVVTDIALGLKALHARGIVHGELKPSNIIFDRDDLEFRIADYGLQPDWSTGVVSSNVARYLAPEDLGAASYSTAQSDIYSFGKVVRAVLHEAPGLNRRDRGLLSWIVSECLHTSPHDRPTVNALVSALQNNSDIFDETALRRLEMAVVVDMDGRVPNILADHYRPARRATAAATESLLIRIRSYDTLRLQGMPVPEITHLLSSLALLEMPKTLTRLPRTTARVSLKALEKKSSPPAEAESLINPHLPIDEDWRREIESMWLGSDDRSTASPKVAAQLDRQLKMAKEIEQSVLESDAFVRSEDVAAIMAPSCPGITVDEVRILRDLGYLISVPHNGVNLYPLFQFDHRSGAPLRCIKEVSSMSDGTMSAWRRAIWWFLESSMLDNESAASWLRRRGAEARVIRVLVDTNAA